MQSYANIDFYESLSNWKTENLISCDEIFKSQSHSNVAQYRRHEPGMNWKADKQARPAHTDLRVCFVLFYQWQQQLYFLPPSFLPCTYYIIRSGWLAGWLVGVFDGSMAGWQAGRQDAVYIHIYPYDLYRIEPNRVGDHDVCQSIMHV